MRVKNLFLATFLVTYFLVLITPVEAAEWCCQAFNNGRGDNPPTSCTEARFDTEPHCRPPDPLVDDVRCAATPGCPGYTGPPVQPQQPGTETKSPTIVPRLQINIPTINFSKATQEGGYLTLPFIGDYIAGLYRYLIGIVGIVAGIMITVGGVQYLTSGGRPERVSAAKDRIKNSLIGLVIAFGTYVILFTINPDLVSFDALKIRAVPRASDLVFAELVATTADTSDTTEPPPPTPPSFTNCPVTLTAPFVEGRNAQTDPRTAEFKQKITSVVGGATPRDRVVQIADAAQKCGVSLGSCGLTVGTANQLAGGICADEPCQGRGAHGINSQQASFLLTYNASLRESGPCDAACKRNAKSVVYNKFRNEIPGYPDSWLEDVEPGDSFIIFNANSNGRGGHNVIFMGWQSGGTARIVQGNWGKIVKGGTLCVKSSCSSPTPLMYVFKPEPPRPRR